MRRKTAERVAIDQKALTVIERGELGGNSVKAIAGILDVSFTSVWRARCEGNVTPELLKGLAAAGYLDPHEVAAVLTVEVRPCPECGEVHTKAHPVERKRPKTFAARVPDELFDEITAEARRLGLTNGEMATAMWTAYQWVTGQAMLILESDVSLADAAGEE